MNNYPPGVTGNEPQITGEWKCRNCGAKLPEDIICVACKGRQDADGNYLTCDACERAREQLEDGICPSGCIEPDYDAINDEAAMEHGAGGGDPDEGWF